MSELIELMNNKMKSFEDSMRHQLNKYIYFQEWNCYQALYGWTDSDPYKDIWK